MILKKDIVKIGSTQKPYGIKGEINILFDHEDFAEVSTDYYFLMIDGIPVPFHIEEYTSTASDALRVKFEDIDDETTASKYVNMGVYLPHKRLKMVHREEEGDWDLFIDYKMIDENDSFIGVINGVDYSTINVLFIVNNGEQEFLIPATEDFILIIDEKEKVLIMSLPEGLLDNFLQIPI